MMKTKRMFALAAAMAVTAAPAALANDPHDGRDVTQKFQSADTDSNGALTPTEWKAAGWDQAKWDKADTDGDGKVTLAEKRAVHASKDKDGTHR